MIRETIINELVGRGYKAEGMDMTKNGVVKQAIVIRSEDTNCVPTVYIDNLINAINEKKMTLADAADYIIKLTEENKVNVDTNEISSRDYILEHVFIGLQKTSDEDIVKCDTDFEGIEKYLHVKTNVGGVEGSYKLTKKILASAGICEAEVWDSAEIHTKEDSTITSMAKMISEMMGIECTEDMQNGSDSMMYVITNKDKYKGASAVLNKPMLAELAKKYDTDKLIVLPSSVHEMIVIPYGSVPMNVEELTRMVEEINASQVNPEERLTDRAYILNVA